MKVGLTSAVDNLVDESTLSVVDLLTIPVVMQAAPQLLNLSMTRYLPHIKIAFTDGQGTVFTINTVADTCTGVNIGDLACHQAIASLFPQAVVAFRELPSNGTLDIGGIGEGGLVITHEITCHMNHMSNGSEIWLTFGLSKDAKCSSLVGISFFKKM